MAGGTSATRPSGTTARGGPAIDGGSHPALLLPAALLRLWAPEALCRELGEEVEVAPDLRLLGPGLVAALPGAGRPQVFDRALALGRRRIAAANDRAAVRALVAPGTLHLGPDAEPVEDEVFRLLAGAPPRLAPGAVHATSHAVYGCEGSPRSVAAGRVDLPSGRQLPIFSIAESAARLPRRRNLEVLGLKRRWVPRPQLEKQLGRELAESRVVRLVGPLGAGKSRLVEATLEKRRLGAAWFDAALARQRLTSWVDELGRAADASEWLIVESLEAAGPLLWRELEGLVSRPDLADRRWILVGREPLPWPRELAETVRLPIPALDAEFGSAVAEQLFKGLGLPADMAARLLEDSGGNPFALEEAVTELARERRMRQVVGSFFFRDDGIAVGFRATPRFILHAEAEMRRLGSAAAVRALATSAHPVPGAEAAAVAAAGLGLAESPDWPRPYLAAELLVEQPGPWGDGVRWATPALRQAVESTLEPVSRESLARSLGRRLVARGGGVAAIWSAYPLIAGTVDGARGLLAVTPGSPAGPTREALLDALLAELETVRLDLGDDRTLELDLMWAILPLARRLGRLHDLRDMLERAVSLAGDQPNRLLAFAAVQAELARQGGDLGDAERNLKRGLVAALGSDERRQGPLLLELARIVALRGRSDEARGLLTKTLEIAELRGRRGLAASCRFHLGNLALAAHRTNDARALHLQALEARRAASMASSVVQSLTALGDVELEDRNYPEALAHQREALAIAEAGGFDRDEALAQLGLGRALSRLGDYPGAAHALRRALALRERRDDPSGEAIARLAVAANHLRLDQVDLALKEARRAGFDLNLKADGAARADAALLLGRIALKQQRLGDAATHFEEAERLHRAAGDQASVLADLGLALQAALAREQVDEVERAFDALAREREQRPSLPSAELFEFDLYRGARWLVERHVREIDGLPFLERAYRELLRKTSFLDPVSRQRFLFQIPEHQAIVDAASREHVGLDIT